MKSVRRFLIIFLALAFLLSIAIGAAIYAGLTVWKSAAPVEVDIQPGWGGMRIGEELHRVGVIRTPHLFSFWVRVMKLDGKLRAGFYEFEAGTTLLAAVDKLKRGEVKSFMLTIIEGWTITDIAASLARQPFIADAQLVQQFVQQSRDPAFIASLGLGEIPSLEGYLFPETYQILRPRDAEGILRQLVDQFWKTYTAAYEMRAQALGLTRHQVITLASIVEKETGVSEERPIVASVFHNRLKKAMPLQSDPTVIYGLPNFNGNVTKQDLANPHPYNTYVHAGFPPGPICSPSRASIEAVLSPAATDYLYFVSKNDGTHHFSSNFGDHTRAVMEYQIRGRK